MSIIRFVRGWRLGLVLAGAALASACGTSGNGASGSGGVGGGATDAGNDAGGVAGTRGGAPGMAGRASNAGEGGDGSLAGSGDQHDAGAAGTNEPGAAGETQGGAAGEISRGGSANAGTSPGGTAGGGAANGGTSDGGSVNAGTANGGTANGGAANGGTANGGTANGGAANAGSGGSAGTSGSAGSGGSGGAPIVSVLTRSYDGSRSNANLLERALDTSNVKAATFGKLFDLPVDDEVYAQILYVPALTVAGAVHDVIFVATVNNSLYAFDANTPGTPLWQRNFNGAGAATVHTAVGQACGQYSDYSGNIGTVATPVIDLAAHTLYVATRTVEAGVTLPRLHAVDLANGQELPNSPVSIQAQVKNTAQQTVAFDATLQNQRMSLALGNGAIYMAFSSFCDTGNYHGWVLSYDATSLTQLGVFNDTPNGTQAGIWQAGAAPVIDPSGNVYLMTGNGSFDGVSNFGESVLKLAPKTLGVLDYFAPANYANLNGADLDLGSAGPLWLPGSNLLVGGGKEGKVYLLDPANMGHSAAADATALQSFQGVDVTVRPNATHHIHNGLASWQSPSGLYLYLAGENDYLRAFRFNTEQRKFELPAIATSTVLPPVGMPGGMLTVSADGARAGSGIVWVTTPLVGDANQAVVPGVLRAYDAQSLALLWESTAPADEVLDFAKFSNPTVANGKVYAASFSRSIAVYGLRSAQPVNLALNAAATGSASCAGTEGPEKAINGSVILGNGDKWCSLAANKFLQVDLGTSQVLGRVVLRHANAGGEPFSMNTRDFKVQVSVDGIAFNDVATVAGNQASITTHPFAAQAARYVRVSITTPTQTADAAARLYELEAYAP